MSYMDRHVYDMSMIMSNPHLPMLMSSNCVVGLCQNCHP